METLEKVQAIKAHVLKELNSTDLKMVENMNAKEMLAAIIAMSLVNNNIV